MPIRGVIMYKLIVLFIVLGNFAQSHGMDDVCYSTAENNLDFSLSTLATAAEKATKQETSEKYHYEVAEKDRYSVLEKDHYKLLHPILCSEQTPHILDGLKEFLNLNHIPVDCSFCDNMSLLDWYILSSIITGDFVPLQQYLFLGADPEYSLNGIKPMAFAWSLQSIDATKSQSIKELLQFYTNQKHHTKK